MSARAASRRARPRPLSMSRQRSMSLSEYQPMQVDRDALEEAYRASVGGGAATSSTRSVADGASARPTSYASNESAATGTSAGAHSASTRSTLSHPRSLSAAPPAPPAPAAPPGEPAPPAPPAERNLAGVGAHHTFSSRASPLPPRATSARPPRTPAYPGARSPPPGAASPASPASPVLATPTTQQFPFQLAHSPRPDQLSPVPGSPPFYAPPLPARPGAHGAFSGAGAGAVPDGAWSDSDETEMRRKRRALPPVPTNVPRPVPPEWQPDYKSAIPPSLVAPSVEHAYAQLSAPPPNLPTRRQQPPRAASRNVSYRPSAAASSSSTERAGQASPHRPRRPSARTRTSSTAGRLSRLAIGNEMPRVLAPPPDSRDRVVPSASALTAEPASAGASASPAAPYKPRPNAEAEVALRASGRTPIWSTHYLDPALRQSLVSVPHPVSAAANAALSGLAAYPKERFNSTIGAPIDGLAKLAKSWVVPPDGRFEAEAGGVELALGVIDRGGEEWGNPKRRKKARVDVVTKSGGVKVDVLEIDANRQIDLRIETKSGDVLVLLPETFAGPVHVTAPARPPVVLPRLLGQCAPVVSPYEGFYTTHVQPPGPVGEGGAGDGPVAAVGADDGAAGPSGTAGPMQVDTPAGPSGPSGPSSSSAPTRPTRQRTGASDHALVARLAKLPGAVRDQYDGTDYAPMAGAGYAAWSRAAESKVAVQAAKGAVVLGYRAGGDEDEAAGLGLVVGAKEDSKRKRWWRG